MLSQSSFLIVVIFSNPDSIRPTSAWQRVTRAVWRSTQSATVLREGPSRWRALEPGWWQWSGRWSRWRCRWWMTVLCVTIKEWVIRNRKRRQGGGQPAVFIEGGLIDTVFLKPTWCHPRRHYHRTKDLGTRITFLTLEQSQHSLSSLPPLICSISMMIIEIKKHNNGWSSPIMSPTRHPCPRMDQSRHCDFHHERAAHPPKDVQADQPGDRGEDFYDADIEDRFIGL